MSVELQKIAVQEIALLVPQKWDKVQLNIEIDDIEGELVISPKGKYFIGDELYELRLGVDATNAFKELRKVMAQNDRESRAWTICDLEIQNDGQYNFQFSYDEPPRLATLKE
ncbi:immunity protein YezG family protein [Vreelandella titanicae]|uniref:immunity protein YezG family protein n=1 Tax=Vreelandella titanicae TaxID=664683 RepID=UPI003FD8EC37